MIRARLRRHGDAADPETGGEAEFVEIDTSGLSGVFAAPRWLRDAGFTAWLLVGVALLVAGTIAVLSLTYTIVLPVLAASVVAAVGVPVVAWLARHRISRGLGAALLLLALIVLGVGVVVVVVGGIVGQSGDIGSHLSDAQDKITGWLKDLGVDSSKAAHATDDAGSATTHYIRDPADRSRKGHLRSLVPGRSSCRSRPSGCLLSVEGRAADPGMGRAQHGGATRSRRHHGQRSEVAAGLLLRGHARAVFNAVVVGGGALCWGSRWRERSPWSPSWARTSPTSAHGGPAPSRCDRAWRGRTDAAIGMGDPASAPRTGSSSSSSSRSPTARRSGSTHWRC